MAELERRTAVEPGHCGCCMTAYQPGAQLHAEVFGERTWWVLDQHPLPKLASRKRKWRMSVY